MASVRVAQGDLLGSEKGGIHSFLGVSYAAPPVREHRMRPPAPVEPWDGVRDATAYGPTSPKADYPPQYQKLLHEVFIPGDDFLNLNIWTPDPAAQGLPVLVWIHGGSFTNGSGSIPEYDGSAFARDGVVAVTINYRLGAEGFLVTPDGTANLGLLDQLAALTWVRDNIASFGGDPAKVTVAGESAGAMSVTTLLSMPQSAGLFRGAICQSGGGHHFMPPETGAMVASTLAESLGIQTTRAAFADIDLDALGQASAAVTTEVQTAPDPAKWGGLALSLLPFMPTVDGDVLAAPPLESIAAGAGKDVRVLVGSNNEEARLFFVAPGVIDLLDEPTVTAGAAAYGVPGESTLALYRQRRPDASPGAVLAAVVSDWFFRIPALRIAEARDGSAQTWVYRFDEQSTACDGALGAAHAVEIPYVFDTLGSPGAIALTGENASQKVADTVHSAWVSFITDGDPGWAPYELDARTTMLFAEDSGTVDDPNSAEREVWNGVR